MYDGYCWLSNNVGPTSVSTRLPMLVAMTAFLLLAIAVPQAFGADALFFAVVYLVIVVVRGVSFLRSTMDGSARAMLAIAPVNFGAAACLFVAVLLPERLRWVAWLAAVLWADRRLDGLVATRDRGSHCGRSTSPSGTGCC